MSWLDAIRALWRRRTAIERAYREAVKLAATWRRRADTMQDMAGSIIVERAAIELERAAASLGAELERLRAAGLLR